MLSPHSYDLMRQSIHKFPLIISRSQSRSVYYEDVQVRTFYANEVAVDDSRLRTYEVCCKFSRICGGVSILISLADIGRLADDAELTDVG